MGHIQSILNFFCALAASSLLIGCGFTGSASFTGSIQGRSFQPTGTVFAYFEPTHAAEGEATAERLVLVMSWMTFDPHRDLDTITSKKLEKLRAGFEKHDTVIVVLEDSPKIRPRATYGSNQNLYLHTYLRDHGKNLLGTQALTLDEKELSGNMKRLNGRLSLLGLGDIKGEAHGRFEAAMVSPKLARKNLKALLLDEELLLHLKL